jgi:hypothetical protein
VTATVEVEPGVHVPLKCDPTPGAGVPPNPCTEPGTQPKCQLCPASPNYWRTTEETR